MIYIEFILVYSAGYEPKLLFETGDANPKPGIEYGDLVPRKRPDLLPEADA